MDRRDNPFDQFDPAPTNPFDQFDSVAPVSKQEANPFDQFDKKPAPKPAAKPAEEPFALTPEDALLSSFATPFPQPKAEAPAPKPKEEPRAYKSRVEALDDAVNMLEEGFDQKQVVNAFNKLGVSWDEIIKHGKARQSEYFRAGAPLPVEQQRRGMEALLRKPTLPAELKAAPEPGLVQGTINALKRGKANISDLATNMMYESRLLSPEEAGQIIARNAKQRSAAAPSYEAQKGMEAIGNAKTYGDAAQALYDNPLATFTMLTDSAIQTIPGLAALAVSAPLGGLARAATAFGTSGTMEYAGVITDVLQENGVDLMNAQDVAKALRNPKLVQEMNDKGLQRGLAVGVFDALTAGLAGRFMDPAQEMVAASKLAAKQAKKATAAAWAKELSVQMAGGAAGEAVAQKLTGEERPADVILEALAEGVTAPVDVLSALSGRDVMPGEVPPVGGAVPPEERVEPTVAAEPTITPERVEPTFGAEPTVEPAIEAAPEPRVPGMVTTEMLAPEAVEQPEGKVAPEEPATPPAAKPAVTPVQEPSNETAAVGMAVQEVPLKDLTLSKDVPQFKMGADAKGVVEPLGGKFERTGVAPIQVWRRMDGSMEVISGRHRLDLARRSGEKTIPAQVHDEAQGFTPTMAAILDAELNIRDGQGKVKDYVNYFKAAGITPEDAESRGLLARSTGKRAYTIATTGSDELVAAVRNDQVGDEAAYYIALNAPNDPRLQSVGMQAVMDGKSANLAVNTMNALKALGVEQDTTTDMFGFDDSAMKEAAAMAQVANRKQKEIQTRLAAITGAAKRPELAKAEGIDVRDPEAVNRRIGELRQMKNAWDNWATNPELIGEIRQERGTAAPSLTLRGETEAEIRAREEAAAAEEQRRRSEEEAARRAEQAEVERKRAEETTGLFQLGQTAEQQMSGMGDLFAAPVVEKPEAKPAPQKPAAKKEEPRADFDKRAKNAIESFVDSIVEQFDMTPETAMAAFNWLRSEKLAEVDPVLGKVNLKDGRFWDGEILRRAALEAEAKGREPGATDEDVKAVGEVFEGARAGQEEELHRLFDKPKEVVRLTQKDNFLTPAEAKKRIAEWKKNAEDQGKTNANSDKIVLSLFDLTGAWSEPWLEAGYQVYRFDIQDKWTMTDERTGEELNLGDINNFSVEYFEELFGNFEGNDVHAILAACPCTDFASSGARHFKAKDASGQTMDSVQLVQQTLATIEYFRPAIWAIENPVGRIEKLTGLPPWSLSFDPYMFGDPYTKKTLLWGRFNPNLPTAPVDPVEGSKMHRMYGGKSLATKNARSVTPEGFAYAFFQANNAIDHPVMALANIYDRLNPKLFERALKLGVSEQDIRYAIDDAYYGELNDAAAEAELVRLANEAQAAKAPKPKAEKVARVVSMTERRQAQIEREEEVEEEATAEESRVEAIKRLKKEYKPLAEKVWQAMTKAGRVLKQSEFPNSLEHKALQRQADDLKGFVESYNELDLDTPLGANVFNALPLQARYIESEGGLERLEELTKRVAEAPKGKKKEEPGLFNIEVPGKRDQATWSPDRVDMLVREFQYTQTGREDDTKAYAAFIDPTEFVRATTGPGELRKELLRAEEGLDMKRLREERQTPFLTVEFVPGEKTMWRIEGHEGRHRMAALSASGVKRAPVLIRMVGEAKAWPPVKEQWLSGQKFGPTSREKGDAVQITDLTPISFARRNELQKKFAGEGIAFSIEQPEAKPTKRMSDKDIRDEQIREYSALRQRLAAVPRRIAAGKSALPGGPAKGMTELERVYLRALVDRAQDLKAAIKISAPRLDSPEQFLARALKEYDAGNISKEVLDVIQAAYKQQPGLLNGLKLSIKQAPEGAGRVAGAFLNMSRIVRLYKGSSGVDDPKTIRHELTHSLEQMMTPEQRGVIIDKWQDDLAKAIRKNQDAAHQKYFAALLKFLDKPSMENYKAAIAAMPSYDMYQFINPSEYWAVNAENLMASQLGGHWQRFKAAMKRMFEALKDVFGFDNKYVVQRAFKDIMTGSKERVTTEMLADRAGIAVSPAQNIEEDKALLKAANRGKTPLPESEKRLGDFFVNFTSKSKQLFKNFIENPAEAAADSGSALIDGVLMAKIKTTWFGAGLESRDFAKYAGQVRTSDGLAIASLALDNALHHGMIGVEVIFRGGLEYSPRSLRLMAVEKKKGMRGVYEAAKSLADRVGRQLSTDIIQAYLEAKRSISIMNEFYERQAAYEGAKEDLAKLQLAKASEKKIATAQALVEETQDDLNAVKKAVSSVTMTEEEMYAFAARDQVYPELRVIMDNYTAVNRNLLRIWRDVGLLSEKRYQTLSSIEDYVPWQRMLEDNADPHAPRGTSTRLTNIGRERLFKMMQPSDIVDFKAKAIPNTFLEDGTPAGANTFKVPPSIIVNVKVGKKKVPANKISVTEEGLVQIDMPIAAGELVVFKIVPQIQNIIDNMTQNVLRMVTNALRQYASNRIVEQYATRTPDGNIMTFPKVDKEKGRFEHIVDGQRRVVEIADPLVAASIYGLGDLSPEVNKYFSMLTNMTRRMITLDPSFQVAQVIKDAPTAALVTGVRNPAALIGGVLKSFVTTLVQPAVQKLDVDIEPTLNILKAAGIGGFQNPSRAPDAEVKRRIGVLNRNAYQASIKLLDHIGDASDMAQRVATYKREMAESGDEALAILKASQVFPILHRGSGRTAQWFFKYVNFMSAYMNSTDVLANAMVGGGLKGTTRARAAFLRFYPTIGMLAGMTILYLMLVGDSDEYKELDDETRLKNIIIPGTDIKVPMNTSGAFFWKAWTELTYNQVISKGTKNEMDEARVRKALSSAAKDMLLGPEPVPSAARAPIEVVLDRSFFTERSITPRRLQNVEAFEQWDATTSELGKRISQASQGVLNPFEADHLVRGLFGSVGAGTQWVANRIAVQAGERPELKETETPLFGRFKRPEVGRLQEDLFYDLKERVDEKYNTWKTMMDRNDIENARKYEDKNINLLQMYEPLNEISRALSEANAFIRELGTSKDTRLTPEKRREQITYWQRQKMQLLSTIDVQDLRRLAEKEGQDIPRLQEYLEIEAEALAEEENKAAQ